MTTVVVRLMRFLECESDRVIQRQSRSFQPGGIGFIFCEMVACFMDHFVNVVSSIGGRFRSLIR